MEPHKRFSHRKRPSVYISGTSVVKTIEEIRNPGLDQCFPRMNLSPKPLGLTMKYREY